MKTNLCTEWCPKCENEVEIPTDKPSLCPICGNPILPCCMCEDCTIICPFKDSFNYDGKELTIINDKVARDTEENIYRYFSKGERIVFVGNAECPEVELYVKMSGIHPGDKVFKVTEKGHYIIQYAIIADCIEDSVEMNAGYAYSRDNPPTIIIYGECPDEEDKEAAEEFGKYVLPEEFSHSERH